MASPRSTTPHSARSLLLPALLTTRSDAAASFFLSTIHLYTDSIVRQGVVSSSCSAHFCTKASWLDASPARKSHQTPNGRLGSTRVHLHNALRPLFFINDVASSPPHFCQRNHRHSQPSIFITPLQPTLPHRRPALPRIRFRSTRAPVALADDDDPSSRHPLLVLKKWGQSTAPPTSGVHLFGRKIAGSDADPATLYTRPFEL
ncbi:hypothetical protein IWX90DRAFT_271200 [Phyllosticta citrichinensis]|uniref:Uncharacterized protein n=1 Tax=Phyllosticta citrichinensis TaxID=1130410 RepID=A0ABR1XMQ3_9PEZI